MFLDRYSCGTPVSFYLVMTVVDFLFPVLVRGDCFWLLLFFLFFLLLLLWLLLMFLIAVLFFILFSRSLFFFVVIVSDCCCWFVFLLFLLVLIVSDCCCWFCCDTYYEGLWIVIFCDCFLSLHFLAFARDYCFCVLLLLLLLLWWLNFFVLSFGDCFWLLLLISILAVLVGPDWFYLMLLNLLWLFSDWFCWFCSSLWWLFIASICWSLWSLPFLTVCVVFISRRFVVTGDFWLLKLYLL